MMFAKAAREAAKLTIAEAAYRAGISEGYLRRVERTGAPHLLAKRLAAIYGCPVEVFLPSKRERRAA